MLTRRSFINSVAPLSVLSVPGAAIANSEVSPNKQLNFVGWTELYGLLGHRFCLDDKEVVYTGKVRRHGFASKLCYAVECFGITSIDIKRRLFELASHASLEQIQECSYHFYQGNLDDNNDKLFNDNDGKGDYYYSEMYICGFNKEDMKNVVLEWEDDIVIKEEYIDNIKFYLVGQSGDVKVYDKIKVLKCLKERKKNYIK